MSWSFTKLGNGGVLSGPSFKAEVYHFKVIAVDIYSISDIECKTQTFLNLDFPAGKVSISDGPSDIVLAVLDIDDSFISAINSMKETWPVELWEYEFSEDQKIITISGPQGFLITAIRGKTLVGLEIGGTSKTREIESITFQTFTGISTMVSGKFSPPITLSVSGDEIYVKTLSNMRIILKKDTSFNYVMKTIANYLFTIDDDSSEESDEMESEDPEDSAESLEDQEVKVNSRFKSSD